MKLSSAAVLLLVLLVGGYLFNESRQTQPPPFPQTTQTARSKPEAVAGVFDYYLLALSWSPTFCLTSPQNEQCTGKGYGFVLHGLWPQYRKGGWPQFCQPFEPLSPSERQQGQMMFPTSKLLSHEWKKHGTCSGLDAQAYLAITDRALARVQIPDALQPSTSLREYSVEQITQLFQQRNPGLPANGLAISCRGPELSEVRVCLGKDLAFGECGKGVRNQCRSGPIRLPPVR